MSVWNAVEMPNIKQDPEVFNFFYSIQTEGFKEKTTELPR